MIGGSGLSASIYAVTHAVKFQAAQQSDQPHSINPTTDEPADENAILPAGDPQAQSGKPRDPSKGSKANGEPLSDEEERHVEKLKETDAKVRAHEQAHAIVGGPYASAPKYEFTTGPDGKRYATSGEVQIDTAPEDGDPEATIRKMDVVIRAALAPAEPSAQDMQVARQAQLERSKAQAELTKQRAEERNGDASPGEDANAPAKAGQGRNAVAQQAVDAYRQAAEADAVTSLLALVAQS